MSTKVRSQQVWIDVTDIIEFLRHIEVVSGVQRVVVETIIELDRSGEAFAVCAFDLTRMQFVVVNTVDVLEVFRQARTSPAGGGSKTSKRLATSLWSTLDQDPIAHPAPGDILAILGAAWSTPATFVGIDRFRRAGAHVFVLIYDLIPLLLPNVPEIASDQFRTYLEWVCLLADRAAFISESAKSDFDAMTSGRAYRPALGAALGLPPGLLPTSFAADEVESARPWPKPYALVVGTIEARKNHLTALHAWRELSDRLGPESVPDLLCAGRVGWGAAQFLRELNEDPVLREKVHLPTHDVSDADLYRLYRDCEFTIFPSLAEGWGLPVSESIAFGKPVICSDAGPLPEAGGAAAIYVTPGDPHELANAVQTLLSGAIDPELEQRIQAHKQVTWESLTTTLLADISAARISPQLSDPERAIKPNTEYPLREPQSYLGVDSGASYQTFLRRIRAMPLTGLPGTPEASVVGRLAATPIGSVARQVEPHQGTPLTQTISIEWALTDVTTGTHLLVAIKNASADTRVTAEVGNQQIPAQVLDEALISIDLTSVTLGEGRLRLSLAAGSETDSKKRLLLLSFVVLDSDPMHSQSSIECLSAMLANATDHGETLAKEYRIQNRRVTGPKTSRETRVRNLSRRVNNKVKRMKHGATGTSPKQPRKLGEPFAAQSTPSNTPEQSAAQVLKLVSLQLRANAELEGAIGELRVTEHRIRASH